MLTEKQIRRGVHRSTGQLEADIRAFLATHNADPKPFRWTKTADEILASIERFCVRTQQIGGHYENQDTRTINLARSRSSFPRPYIWRLTSLSLVTAWSRHWTRAR